MNPLKFIDSESYFAAMQRDASNDRTVSHAKNRTLAIGVPKWRNLTESNGGKMDTKLNVFVPPPPRARQSKGKKTHVSFSDNH